MYRPLRGFKQSVPYLVIGVQTCCLDYYTSCSVGNVHKNFQGCTVDVQAAMVFQQLVPNIFVGVQTCCLDHYTLCGVGYVRRIYQGCTVNEQATTWF